MKKLLGLLSLVMALILTGCYSRYDLERAHQDGYQSGYDRGYIEAMTGKDAKEHTASSITSDKQKATEPTKPDLIALTKPYSGTILKGQESDTEFFPSEITVNADTDHSCVVSLKDRYGATVLSFFVKAGETATVSVPQTKLYVYFASGKTWYGYGKGKMFGENTVYSKDDKICDFSPGSSWEYTLYPVSDGNFTESLCSEEEFF